MHPGKIEYWSLTGDEFEDAVYGSPVARPTLAAPALKYYHPWPPLGPKVTRRVFLATSLIEPPLPTPVGMLETMVSPHDARELWVMFVSVDPAFQRRGISRALLRMLIAHVQEEPRLIVRSSSSGYAPQGFQPFVDQILNETRLPWRQGNRTANIPST